MMVSLPDRPAFRPRCLARGAALWFALGLASSSAFAQTDDFVNRRAYPWTPLTGSVSTVGKLAVGEFHGDGILDAALIGDGRIVVTTPHYRAAEGLQPALSLTTDLDVLQAASGDARDSIFCATSAGLVRWRHVDGEWQDKILTGPWGGVDAVSVHEHSGSGIARVLVLDRTAATIHSLFVTRDDGVFVLAAEIASTGLAGIDEFTLLDWDGDGTSELVISHAGGLASCELDGSQPQNLGNAAVHAMAPIGPTSDGRERLAMLMQNVLVPQNEWLVVLRSDGTTEVPVDLGTWTGAGSWDDAELASGDFESDDDLDLLISERGGSTLWTNTGTDQAFDGSSLDVTPEGATTLFVPAIGMAEFEGEFADDTLGSVPDLDVLLAFPGYTTSEAVFLEVGTTSYDQGPRVVALAPYAEPDTSTGGSSSRSVSAPAPPSKQEPETDFGLTLTWQIPPAVPAGVEFEVITWKQPGIDTPLDYIEAEHYALVSETVQGGDEVSFNLSFEWDGDADEVLYYLESRLRLGARTANVKLLAVAPSEATWDHYEAVMLPADPGTYGPTVGRFEIAGAAKMRPGGSGPIDDWDPGVIFGQGAVTTVP